MQFPSTSNYPTMDTSIHTPQFRPERNFTLLQHVTSFRIFTTASKNFVILKVKSTLCPNKEQ